MACKKKHPPTAWSLRPAGEHAALREAAQAAGWRLRALPLQRLRARDAGASLAQAFACPLRIATSPAAVRFARAAVNAWPESGIDLAVGAGTAAALREAGAGEVRQPQRMDSEGLLALSELQALEGCAVALITAPGGRGLLPKVLVERGAAVHRADVYERIVLQAQARRLAAFAESQRDALLVSSGEAFEALLRALASRGLRLAPDRPLVASSERLAELANAAGLRCVQVAASATPSAMVAALGEARP